MVLSFYDFLFYCYYLLFASIKRKEPIDHVLASVFLSVILTLNILTVLMITNVLAIAYQKFSLTIPIVLLFIAIKYMNRFYFIRNERYLVILERYKKIKINRKVCISLAIILTFLTFGLFWFIGIIVDNRITPD